MTKDTILHASPGAQEGDMRLICTADGRIAAVGDRLRAGLGHDPTGRYLTEYLSEGLVRAMTEAVGKGVSFPFRGEYNGRSFSAEAFGLTDGVRIDIAVQEKQDSPFLNLNASRYLAREINEDLAVMLPTLAALEDTLDADQSLRAALLRRGLFRLMRLSRNMEDCAAAENGAVVMLYSKVDLAGLCRELSEQLAPMLARMGIRLETAIPQDKLELWADREKLIRMILNLISNAVSARPESEGTIRLALDQKDGQYTVTVTDNGRGFDPAAYKGLRHRFEQTDPRQASDGGAGFGLALVEAYAKRHRGALMITGNEGGTVACILLRADWEPPENERLELDTHFSRYGAGIDPVLVELSTVLPKEEYRK